MTRKELAKKSSHSVRSDSRLFTQFKKYITEDAPYIFAAGEVPPGCFGCSFHNHFSKWSRYIIQKENVSITTTPMENPQPTYTLKQDTLRVYFDGKIIDKHSPDTEWIAWINFIPQQQEQRKQHFAVLPQALHSPLTPPEQKAEKEPILNPKKKKQSKQTHD